MPLPRRAACAAFSVAIILCGSSANAQLGLGISAGYQNHMDDGANGGLTLSATVAPCRVLWGAIGVELGYDRMSLVQDSVPSSVNCLGPNGETACSFRLRRRESTIHAAVFTRFGRPARGVRPFGDFGLGFYRVAFWDQQDAWADDGTYLPNLSYPGSILVWNSGLGMHAHLGMRYQPGQSPVALTLAARGRLAGFLTGGLESFGRNAVGVMAGVGWR